MKICRYLLIGALVLQLVVPDAEAGWFSRTFKKIGNGFKKAGKAVWKGVKKQGCKVNDTMDGLVMYPFSDDFSDYDLNQDKEIEYEEFAFAVMKQFPMGHPEELREPFFWADANGDERLDMDEFIGAPFMFAHYEKGVAPVA